MLEWWDYHLYEFAVGGKKYQETRPDAEGEDATKTRLAKLRLSVGDKFTYVYDFGDDWKHTIEVEGFTKVNAADSPPYVTAGERRGPPEDCGGVHGFERFLNAIKDPTDPEHEEYRTWVGENYDPDVFDTSNRTARRRVGFGMGKQEALSAFPLILCSRRHILCYLISIEILIAPFHFQHSSLNPPSLFLRKTMMGSQFCDLLKFLPSCLRQ